MTIQRKIPAKTNEIKEQSLHDERAAKAARVKMLAAHGMDKSKIRSILALPHDNWGQACLDAFAVGRKLFRRRVKVTAAIQIAKSEPAEAEELVARAKRTIKADALPDIPARWA